MATEPRHHRIILHLSYGSAERATIRAAAELAQMLGLALHGVFLQEEALTELTALPFVREFRLATGAWQALDPQRIAQEQRQAVEQARRLFDEAAAALGISFLFDTDGDRLSAASRHGDIIVVAQPRLPAEQLAHATAGWLEAAHSHGASVMLVPQSLARREGPIAAVVCAEGDPALAVAAQLAVAAGESLMLLVFGADALAAQVLAKARAAGLPASKVSVHRLAGIAPEQVVQGLSGGGERLVVLARGACGADDAAVSSHIASARSVPVLVVEA
jgi:hypothetical protein